MNSVDSTETSPKEGSKATCAETQEKPTLKEYSRADVFQHNKSSEAWLLIDPYIYDVTEY